MVLGLKDIAGQIESLTAVRNDDGTHRITITFNTGTHLMPVLFDIDSKGIEGTLKFDQRSGSLLGSAVQPLVAFSVAALVRHLPGGERYQIGTLTPVEDGNV